MEPKHADRILKLVRKWQDARRWLSSFTAAEVCRDEDQKARRAGTVYAGEVAGHEQRATQYRQVVDLRTSELNKLETLLRQHAPKLLTLVPIVNFCESPPADLAPWLNAMREIEGEIRVLLQVEDQKPAKGDYPKASVEQRALAVLVNHPDWTVKQIAADVDTSREYLSSKHCPKFKAARAAIHANSIPAGTKTKTGEMEAAGDDDLDFDEMDARMKPKSKR